MFGPIFMFQEQDRGFDTPCWVWARCRNTNGYGVASIGGGKARYAHRLMYELEKGPIPEGLDLDHLCRNPACINPAHLEPVTHRENMRRGKGTKLTEGDVREIRASALTCREIAAKYGISRHRAWVVKSGYIRKREDVAA